MIILKKNIIFIYFVLSFIGISCTSNNTNEIIEKIHGEWKLDSVSNYKNKFYKYNHNKLIEFPNKTYYTLQWWSGDVVNNRVHGRFFILYNPNRKIPTLTMIPNIEIDSNDTIRPENSIIDIFSIAYDRLVLIDGTNWYNNDTLHLKYNTKYIYKRVK